MRGRLSVSFQSRIVHRLYRRLYNRTDGAGTAAVFFDVDFTLIHPGPTFQGVGYRERCARHGIAVDAARFDAAVPRGAGVARSRAGGLRRRHLRPLHPPHHRAHGRRRRSSGRVRPRDLRRLGRVPSLSLYDDAEAVLRELAARQLKLGLISNSHRWLDVVPGALRAPGAHRGRRVVGRARLHEAAPEHLRGRAHARRAWTRARR